MSFEENLYKKGIKCKSISKLYKLPLQLLSKAYKDGIKPADIIDKKVRILLLTSTCNGFGDVVFSYKLRKYLVDWYGDMVEINIATNGTTQFLNIDSTLLPNLIQLKTRAKDSQCRTFNTMTPYNYMEFSGGNMVYESLENYDLYLVAPITADFEPSYKEVHSLIKNSNRFNTHFLSEYNMKLHKDIAFNIGVGKSRMGIFMIDDNEVNKISKLENPYSIIYIAENDDYVDQCYEGFLELLTSKYKYPVLDVVCPNWMKDEVKDNIENIIDVVDPYYTKISIIYRDKTILYSEDKGSQDSFKEGGELVFRCDIYPLEFDKVVSLYKYSLPHVLLTGDQSFTDFLSVRYQDSVPFYQGLPWKQNLYTTLATVLPNKFFKSYKTSCGSIKAINYDPDFGKFMKKWDFRERAKPLMDVIMMSVGYKGEEYVKYKKEVVRGRTVKSIKNKFEYIFE